MYICCAVTFVILMSCLLSYSARDNVIGLQHELFLAPGLFQLNLTRYCCYYLLCSIVFYSATLLFLRVGQAIPNLFAFLNVRLKFNFRNVSD